MSRTMLLLASVLLFAVSCSAAGPTDEDLQYMIQQNPDCTNFSRFLPKMDFTKPSELPCSRPAPYNYERNLTLTFFNGTDWVRPPYDPSKPYAVSYKDPKSKAVIWTLRHAPIRGVTPAMVRWMWNNMDKMVSDPRDGSKWQVFQLMHPSDHVRVMWNTKELIVSPWPGSEPGNATKWVWTEIPASGCKVNSSHVFCPEKQPGYLCNNTDAATLKKIATLNVSMVTSELSSDVDETGYEVAVVTMRYFFNIKDAGCIGTDLWRAFVEFRNVMYYPPGAKEMRVVTTWTVGWNDPLAVIFNQPYLEPLWAGFTPGGKLWRVAVNYYIMHTLQEWAALPVWLPKVYAAETGAKG